MRDGVLVLILPVLTQLHLPAAALKSNLFLHHYDFLHCTKASASAFLILQNPGGKGVFASALILGDEVCLTSTRLSQGVLSHASHGQFITASCSSLFCCSLHRVAAIRGPSFLFLASFLIRIIRCYTLYITISFFDSSVHIHVFLNIYLYIHTFYCYCT